MKEILIMPETAELAKEKKFDEPTWYFYVNNELEEHYPENFDSLEREVWQKNSEHRGSNVKSFYSAPTQSLLQKWLREVHQININVMCQPSYNHKNTNESHWEIYLSTNNPYKPIFTPKDNNRFDSFEKALEIGLQEALKLI